jgi:hypothetical protein
MSHSGRHSADDTLAVELATGRSIRKAAEIAGVSEKTAHRRNADPAFRARVAELRKRATEDAIDRIGANMGLAIDALRKLLITGDEPVKFKAAAKIIDLVLKQRESPERACNGMCGPVLDLLNHPNTYQLATGQPHPAALPEAAISVQASA